MAEIKYEVVQRIAVLSERPRGWERQLNLILSLIHISEPTRH